ncbi:hypothetical protein Htur_0731 [Haloterrigena turkmenica DSM 5511]|uniref:Uncharacterized protein n=1 Tax=Haloterrigena turkmenica (strain ATCC 51198 / DSM 5511 / JCM 9101 / NCIMB 13204 / VKM B-1734 / 4k) TaxID=543526 RepID=D2RX16_HALTV|nr:hypothetical protein [Haloterrigena turkmenica]ADB59628.1 hypothetical protein Htur_0731 [Haloterrigena turkmenica DSM 5511]
MSEDLYRCVCHTCGTERLIEGLEGAQTVFNRHAERSHEVELLNQETQCQYSESSAADETPPGDSPDDTPETEPDDG